MPDDAATPTTPPVALVTGASAGLGRALAVELTGRGLVVAGIARRAAALEETRSLCADGLFHPFAGSIADAAWMRGTVAEIESRLGPVAILINNAAVYRRVDFLSVQAEPVMDEITINLNGYVAATSAVLPGMVARGRGRIIYVSSFAGDGPVAGSLGYSVSKAGVRSLSRAVAAETRGRLPGIVVTEWLPAIMDTAIGRAGADDPAMVAVWGANLALDADPVLHDAVFLRDRELPSPRSRSQRVKDFVMMRRPRPPRQL